MLNGHTFHAEEDKYNEEMKKQYDRMLERPFRSPYATSVPLPSYYGSAARDIGAAAHHNLGTRPWSAYKANDATLEYPLLDIKMHPAAT